MFAIIGVLAVIAVIGFLIYITGGAILFGAVKLIVGIVLLIVIIFALRGCMMS